MTLPLLNGRAELSPAFLAVVADAVTRDTVRDVAARFGWTQGPVRDGGVMTAREILQNGPAPGVLLVDVSGVDDVLAAMDALADVCEPHTRVIAIGQANDVALYRGLMRMGVSDYLVKPVSAEALSDALHRAERPQAAEPAKAKPARVIALIGARGGVGATSVALSLAWSLAHDQQQRTVLFDLDMQFGAAALSLDLEPGRGLREILSNPERIDSLLIGSAMIHQSERLRILGAEEPLEDEVEVAPAALQALLAGLSETTDVVVVDVPRRLDRAARDLLARADAVCVVTDLSLAAMRDTQRLLILLRGLRPQGGVTTLASRVGGVSGEVPAAEFERGIGAKLDLEIPADAKAAVAAAEQARPLIAAAKASPAAEALRKLAHRLSDATPAASPAATAEKAGSLLQRLLGR
jgi:pilus assembly protein CpaE